MQVNAVTFEETLEFIGLTGVLWQDIIIVINAWNTSGLAYDGSGPVKRGRESEKTNGCYFLCEFSIGKVYHADLTASYNIGARYYIREILKSCSETERLALEVKVPEVARGSTCTLSALIYLNAVIAA